MKALHSSIAFGAAAFAALLIIYFSALTLASGWEFTKSQFAEFWPYIVTLALGFGAQVALYVHLKRMSMAHHHAKHLMATSGTTSTAAMLACCTHYLANVLPILGAAGIVSLVAQYQVQLFWIALLFNLAGLVFISRQCWSAKRAFAGSETC